MPTSSDWDAARAALVIAAVAYISGPLSWTTLLLIAVVFPIVGLFAEIVVALVKGL
jgi:hypothetical protein